MRPVRPIRLPLQLGVTSLWSAARVATFLVPGVMLAGAGAWWGLAHDGALGAVLVAALGVLSLGLAAGSAVFALRTRPSDVILGPDAVSVEGGPHAGERLAWDDLDADALRLDTAGTTVLTTSALAMEVASLAADAVFDAKAPAHTRGRAPLWSLQVGVRAAGGRAARTLVLAEAERPIEQQSLQAVFDSLGAVLRPAPPRPPPASPEVLRCPACLAPAQPVDAASTACAFCGEAVPVPAELRERLRAHAAATGAGASLEKRLADLLDQPGASSAARRLAVVSGLMAAAWGLVGVVALVRGLRGELDAADLGPLGFVAGALVLALFLGARASLVNRQALRLVTLSFGARPPLAPGAPSTCRRCAGPLPGDGGRLVLRCLYCDAENVLGLDARPDVRAAEDQQLTLEAAFAQRARERRQWAWASAGAAFLFVNGAGLAVGGLEAPPSVKWQAACEAGDLAACTDLGLSRSVRGGDDEAAALYARACDGGVPEACWRLGDLAFSGRGVPTSLPRSAALYGQACDAGAAQGCQNLADAYDKGWGVAADPERSGELRREACRRGLTSSCR